MGELKYLKVDAIKSGDDRRYQPGSKKTKPGIMSAHTAINNAHLIYDEAHNNYFCYEPYSLKKFIITDTTSKHTFYVMMRGKGYTAREIAVAECQKKNLNCTEDKIKSMSSNISVYLKMVQNIFNFKFINTIKPTITKIDRSPLGTADPKIKSVGSRKKILFARTPEQLEKFHLEGNKDEKKWFDVRVRKMEMNLKKITDYIISTKKRCINIKIWILKDKPAEKINMKLKICELEIEDIKTREIENTKIYSDINNGTAKYSYDNLHVNYRNEYKNILYELYNQTLNINKDIVEVENIIRGIKNDR